MKNPTLTLTEKLQYLSQKHGIEYEQIVECFLVRLEECLTPETLDNIFNSTQTQVEEYLES